MKHQRFLGVLPVCCLFAFAPGAFAQNSLTLGSDSVENGQVASIDLTVSSADEVQGFVAAFDWDDSIATGIAINESAVLATADVVVSRIESNYGVLGVVVDTDGVGDSALPTGDNVVATIDFQCVAPGTTAVEFADGAYATVDGGPLLDNIVVIDGLSIGVSDALGLVAGEVSCTAPPDRLTIESGGNVPGTLCGDIRVLLTNNSPVEGFVLAIGHGTGLSLSSIALGGAAAAADFTADEILPNGGTFGVVMDLVDPQPAGPVIAPGSGQHIATFSYCCDSVSATPEVIPLQFVDGALGTPAKDNILVVAGESIGVSDGLELVNGTFTCQGDIVPPVEDCDDGIDNDGDGDVDCDDSDCANFPACQEPADISFVCSGRDGEPLEASRGGSLEVCFGLVINEDGVVGHGQPDHIQGFSMAVTFCDELTCASDDLDIAGTILEALGAEFVSLQCDNDPNDGDGKELIIGVLIDALPPFDGATIAPSFLNEVQAIGYVDFEVSDDAVCGDTCEIAFQDGLNGVGRVPVKNLIAHQNHSASPLLEGCIVEIVDQERFFRGDCNFSLGGSMAVDIADAAAVISYLFQEGSWQFIPGCLDACDCQDDGRVDLADAVCILQYLFLQGNSPPAPGPGWDVVNQVETPEGPDPTDDKLDCELGKACVLMPH